MLGNTLHESQALLAQVKICPAGRLLYRVLAGLEKLTLHQPPSADDVGFEQFRAFSPHKMWHRNRQNAHKRLNFQFARKGLGLE